MSIPKAISSMFH